MDQALGGAGHQPGTASAPPTWALPSLGALHLPHDPPGLPLPHLLQCEAQVN